MKKYGTACAAALALTMLAATPASAQKEPPKGAKGADLPDLIILTEGTKLEWSGKCDRLSPVIVGDVAIRNIGKAPSPIILRALIRVAVRGSANIKDDDVKINAIQPGETQTTKVSAGRFRSKKGMKGDIRIEIKADPHGLIKESNERNNTLWVKVKVDCP
ncbi:MAG: CARDB domain-containing protein [Hyphomicrobiaceae bacterium]